MSQAAKAQEPSMEEILASIRRIVADDDATKASAPPPPPKPAPAPAPPKAAAPPPPPPPPPAPAAPAKASNNQDDIDAMLAELDAIPAQKEPPPPPKVAAPPPPPPPPAPEPEPEPEDKDDILDLTEAMAAPAPAAGFRTIDGKSDVMFNEGDKGRQPSMVDLARRQFEHELGGPTLISPGTSAAVDSAFNTLAHTVLSENARTLEDLVKEMLRPMLKGWLDDNLPGMVERLVRAEIERVSRGRNK
jgi:uncharacterized protein